MEKKNEQERDGIKKNTVCAVITNWLLNIIAMRGLVLVFCSPDKNGMLFVLS